MSRRRRDRSPLGQGAARQRAQRRAHHAARTGHVAEPPADNPLLATLRPALRSDDPTAFWVAAAPLVSIATDPPDMTVPLPEGEDLVDTFLGVDIAATPADVEQSGDFEQWPMLRPFVEFVVSRMPEGGTGYDDELELVDGLLGGGGRGIPERPPWLLEDGTDLVEEFVASEHAAGLTRDTDLRNLVSALMVILDATVGDALAWDAEITGWMLTDLLPTSPVFSDEASAQIPAVLPPLVAWSLERGGAEPSQIARTQQRLAPLLEQFPELRADPRVRALRLEEQVDFALDVGAEGGSSTALRMADLALRVGGFTEIGELDAEPLPAEELATGEIPEDLQELAAEIDAHLVEGVGALLALTVREIDADEVLTACRRLLVRIAQLDDSVLRRRASPRNTAAALPHRFNGIALADPGLLIGAARAQLLREWELLEEE